MAMRRIRTFALFLPLSFTVPASPAGKETPVTVIIPPQAIATVIPVRMTLPASLATGTDSRTGWRLVEGPRTIPAQAEDTAGCVLCFLLPVAASQAEVRRSLRLERAPRLAEQVFQYKDAEGKFLHLLEGSSPVLTYNYGMILKPGVPEDRRRSSYVHPLFSPDGTMITDDFPKDHYHHRGLSWMWPVIEVGGEKHSLWDIRGIAQRFERWVAREAGPVFARLAVENGWYVGDGRVAKEHVEFVIYRAGGEARALDVTLTFEATDRPVSLAGTSDQQKGYGGFCLRFAPRKETWVTTSGGSQEKDTDRVPFPWADLSAVFSQENRTSGAAIFVDAGNPGFPNGWTLRNYGFLGVAWPGLQSVVLQPGRPVTLRHRIWLHAGDVEKGAVAAQYAAYSKPLLVEFSGKHK